MQYSRTLFCGHPTPPLWFLSATLLGYTCRTEQTQLPWPIGAGIACVQALRIISCDELGIGAALSQSGIPLEPSGCIHSPRDVSSGVRFHDATHEGHSGHQLVSIWQLSLLSCNEMCDEVFRQHSFL